jgi:Cu2+-exporting ATPase
MAVHSRHPLSRALATALQGPPLSIDTQEIKGCGLEATVDGRRTRLGKRNWCTDLPPDDDTQMELWLVREGTAPVRLLFADALRQDAHETVATLKNAGIHTLLLSGDRDGITQWVANDVGIETASGGLTPLEKTQKIAALKAQGARVLMVGDGLNDAPSLATADVSMSPTSAIDITQNAADIVFQGNRLSPVTDAWRTARFAQQLVRQNFLLAILYNVVAIPLAVAGYVTPLIAAIAMSSSSLLVIANAMRLTLRRARA